MPPYVKQCDPILKSGKNTPRTAKENPQTIYSKEPGKTIGMTSIMTKKPVKKNQTSIMGELPNTANTDIEVAKAMV